MTTPEPPRQTHRNETLLYIVLPVLGAGLLILGGVVIALVLQRRVQVHILADVLTTILLLCPLVVCFFPVYLIVVVLALAMGRVHDGTESLLEKLRINLAGLTLRVRGWLQTVNKQVINLGAKIEPYLDRLSFFEKHNPRGKEHDE